MKKIQMHKIFIYLLPILLNLFLISRLPATTIDGGTGLIRVPYASTLGKGKILVNSQSANTIQKGASVVSWYYAGITQFGAIYGYNRFLDLWFNYRGYQDNVSKEDLGLGGNLKIGTKYNFYNNRRLHYNLAGELIVIAPTGQWANIPWEPYSSGQLELQLNLVGSFAKYYHGIFGYIFHNDADIGFGNSGDVPKHTPGEVAIHELVTGVAAEYPIIKDILVATAELTGRYLLNNKEGIKSSEPWTVLTLGAKYFLNNNLYFSGGADIRLTGGKNDVTVFSPWEKAGPFWDEADNYPTWCLHLDVNWLAYQRYRVIQGKQNRRKRSSASKKSLDTEEGYLDLLNDFGEVGASFELQEKMRLYKQLQMEQKETQEAEQELDEIRIKRKEAESELQKLRSLLEELD